MTFSITDLILTLLVNFFSFSICIYLFLDPSLFSVRIESSEQAVLMQILTYTVHTSIFGYTEHTQFRLQPTLSIFRVQGQDF